MDNQAYYIRNGALSYELDQEHTDHHLTRAEMQQISECLVGIHSAVHLCCGAGRHVAAFAGLGIASIGIDISPALLWKAREALYPQPSGQAPRLVLGDAILLPFKERSTECVTLLGNSLCLFPEDRCKQLLAQVARILTPKGLFIVDVPDPDYLKHQGRDARKTTQTIQTDTLGEIQWTWVRQADPRKRVLVSKEFIHVQVTPKVRQKKQLHFEFHLYEPEKACSLSEIHGLRPEHTLECEDASGRYKGMLRKRKILVLRSTRE